MKDQTEIEKMALALGIPLEDLKDPLCVKYLKLKIKGQPETTGEREPLDANGFTTLSVQIIRPR